MSRLYYFRSASKPDRHAFTDDEAGAKLPADEGPWRFVRTVAPDEGWTPAAEIEAVRAGVKLNGFFLADWPGDLTFNEAAVKPGD
jgi:hypothetical protein